MSLLSALRAYVGLGPEEDYEDRYYDDRTESPADIDLAGSDDGSTRHLAEVAAQASRRARSTRSVERTGAPRLGASPVEAVTVDGHPMSSGRSANRRKLAPSVRADSSRGDLEGWGQYSEDSAQPASHYLVDRHDRLPDDRIQPGDRRHDPGTDRAEHHGRERDRADRFLSDEPYLDDDDDRGLAGGAATEGAVVTSIDSVRVRPRTLAPTSFGDAKLVADEFKRDSPVVLNLQGLDRQLARRLIDFSSGLCYACEGSMEKLAPQVFLLTPVGQEVSDEDRLRIEQRGYAR